VTVYQVSQCFRYP